jgi:hypothetical protein
MQGNDIILCTFIEFFQFAHCYGSGKNYLTKLQNQDVPKKDKAEHGKIIDEFEEGLEKVKLSLLDSNKVINKNQDGITVKNVYVD